MRKRGRFLLGVADQSFHRQSRADGRGPITGLCTSPMIYHCAPADNLLERRTDFQLETWQALTQGLPERVLLGRFHLGPPAGVWKHGERAYRHCQHDVGHLLAAVSSAASRLPPPRKDAERAKPYLTWAGLVNSDPQLSLLCGTALLGTDSEKDGPIRTQSPCSRKTDDVGPCDIRPLWAPNSGFQAKHNREREKVRLVGGGSSHARTILRQEQGRIQGISPRGGTCLPSSSRIQRLFCHISINRNRELSGKSFPSLVTVFPVSESSKAGRGETQNSARSVAPV